MVNVLKQPHQYQATASNFSCHQYVSSFILDSARFAIAGFLLLFLGFFFWGGGGGVTTVCRSMWYQIASAISDQVMEDVGKFLEFLYCRLQQVTLIILRKPTLPQPGVQLGSTMQSSSL